MKSSSPLALVGCDAPKTVIISLESMGFSPCVLPSDGRLPQPIRSHADMLIFSVGNTVFCSDSYFSKNKNIFEHIAEYGYKIQRCNVDISDKYPCDIAFNAFYARNKIWGNIPFIAKEIRDYAKTHGIDTVPLKQGYAKCSAVLLGDGALISADSGILRAAQELGFSTLKIENSPDAVSLSGYDYGFLGGASGVYEDNVYFTGNINKHPRSESIVRFCREHGFEPVSLCDGPLTDIGGIIFLPELR